MKGQHVSWHHLDLGVRPTTEKRRGEKLFGKQWVRDEGMCEEGRWLQAEMVGILTADFKAR